MSGMFWKRARALLATARVANVPSVVSNVWVGAVVGSLSGLGEGLWGGIGASVWWLVGAGVCLYVAGNFLNDWYDREWDEKHRPERALPSGLFCPSTYLAVAVGLVLMAGVCAWAVNQVAVALAGMILIFVVAYTVLHKRTPWGVVWVGLCRALLVVLGVTGTLRPDTGSVWFSEPLLVAGLASIPLFCYIVGLSVSARFEAKRYAPQWVASLSVCMLALPLVITWIGMIILAKNSVNLLPAVPFAVWMMICHSRRKDIPRYVAGLLAGIPLVDLMVFGASIQAVVESRWIIAPWVLLVPLAAFGAGLLLQRVAPAS
jgi:4-hydroxybenzoate polyprenyltransferase